ncbi:uncharacterized protein TNCT_664771 [Trichonephila clavata]|uniref:Uncharacterized protein n=1 Tax=Trichonephila clavata TaxID=2740835 RepID=A0A8X6FHX0_TRICU|nr:uncharacterized protein TNCT_664771 [Trichonephila clavata]
MDVSGTKQLSLCIRYVDIPDLQAPVLREDFVGFIPINDQSSENLVNVILQRCDELNLDMTKCVGQGYDWVENMAGHLSGVQTRIRENYLKIHSLCQSPFKPYSVECNVGSSNTQLS